MLSAGVVWENEKPFVAAVNGAAYELMATAGGFADRLASGPAIGIGHIKGQLNDAYDASLEQAWKNEAMLLGMRGAADSKEAIAAFVERRAPRFTGR
jgi:2-(1,2-epoxy-1,2-dihydrophenyl)acetyl-CoA isomerase